MNRTHHENLDNRVTLICAQAPASVSALTSSPLYFLHLARREGTLFESLKPKALRRYDAQRSFFASQLAHELAGLSVSPTHVVSPPTRFPELSGFYRQYLKTQIPGLVDLSHDVTRLPSASPVSQGGSDVQQARDALRLSSDFPSKVRQAACVLIVDDVIRSGTTVRALLMALDESGLSSGAPVIAAVPLSLRQTRG